MSPVSSPSSYRTLSLETPGGPFQIRERPLAAPGPGQVTVRLHAAALNHRDLWIYKGTYAGVRLPVVLGSDGAGVVESAGPGSDPAWIGRKVILNPSLDWGADEAAPGPEWRILGMPEDGTFAERISVPAENLAAMPAHLSFEEAAALPLAGLTAYRALFVRGRIGKGEKLLVTGIGGGVALAILRFALGAGAEVYVTSGSPEKLRRAQAMGVRGGADYRQEGWVDSLRNQAGAFDCIVDSAGGPGFTRLFDLAKPGGRLVFFGATAGNPPELPLRKLFWNHLTLLGTTLGSPRDFQAMVDRVAETEFRPVIDAVYPFAEADAALARMEAGEQFGKLVIKMS